MGAEALVIGSVALDSVETPHGKVEDVLGGSASYGSVAASYFAPVRMVAVVGRDFDPRHVEAFQSRGIDTSGLEVRQDGETFRWHGYYVREMNRAHTNTTLLNVFAEFAPKITKDQRRCPFVFLANIDPVLQLNVLDQLEDPKLVLLDTMNFWIEGSKPKLTEVIERVNILVVNEDEARQFMETTSLIKAGRELRKLGPSTVIVKKGEHGALLFQEDGIWALPAYPLEELRDPTGAGDTFAGGLIGYLAQVDSTAAEDIRRAVIVGTAMASFVVEDFSLRRTLAIRPGEIRGRTDELLRIMALPSLEAATVAGRYLTGV